MKINSVSSNNYQVHNNNQKPAFKSMIHVSDVVVDCRPIKDGTKEYNLLISKAIKFLKNTKNQSLECVKNFWMKADSYHTKDLHRTADFMATASHARELTRASHDIKYKNGDKTQYQKIKKMLINDTTARLKENNIEKEIYIKGHNTKARGVVIDEVGFKNKGEKLELKNPLDELNSTKSEKSKDMYKDFYAKPFDDSNPFDVKGQGWLRF